jgi:hypothetical protein
LSRAQPPSLDLNELNFDTCERLRHLDGLLMRMGLPENARVLDAGGYPCYMARAFPHWNVITADIYANGHPPYVKASGAALPFLDGAFEFTVACDVLEHVPPQHRDNFLKELLRVSRTAVIVAGPYTTPGAKRAEDVVRGLLPASSPAQTWLAEHAECGLPCLAETMAAFAGDARGMKVVPVGSLTAWMLFFAAQAAGEHKHHISEQLKEFISAHNRLAMLTEDPVGGPAYRHAVVATLTEDCWHRLHSSAADVVDHAHEWQLVEDYVDSLGETIRTMLSIVTSPEQLSGANVDSEYVSRLEHMLASRGQNTAAPNPAHESLPARLSKAWQILKG